MTHQRRPETCVGAVVVRGDELLLIRRGRGAAEGKWSVPGGRVEWGETLEEAVVREVAEETGLDVMCGPYLGFVERISGDTHYVIHDFRASVRDDRALVAGDDASEAAWVPLDGLADVDLVDGMLAFLDEHRITAREG